MASPTYFTFRSKGWGVCCYHGRDPLLSVIDLKQGDQNVQNSPSCVLLQRPIEVGVSHTTEVNAGSALNLPTLVSWLHGLLNNTSESTRCLNHSVWLLPLLLYLYILPFIFLFFLITLTWFKLPPHPLPNHTLPLDVLFRLSSFVVCTYLFMQKWNILY